MDVMLRASMPTHRCATVSVISLVGSVSLALFGYVGVCYAVYVCCQRQTTIACVHVCVQLPLLAYHPHVCGDIPACAPVFASRVHVCVFVPDSHIVHV